MVNEKNKTVTETKKGKPSVADTKKKISAEQTEKERIEATARKILNKYRADFEELAK